ncbi:CHAT domain-containing protein [Streptomyces flaveolus]|uniref:CHAT domain-containing protein n=1 Tax=Streptomyces flaveolus TaxID=67297 RepID=UPI003322C68B
MDGTENGGLRALHTWVIEATGRAVRLLPSQGRPTPDRAELDSVVTELAELERALTHDERLRTQIVVQRGVMLALRHLSADGDAEDRREAQRLLRLARRPGAPTDAESRRYAAYWLAMLGFPLLRLGGGIGRAPAPADVLAWYSGLSTEEQGALFTELSELLPDIRALDLPPEAASVMDQMAKMLETLDGVHQPGGIARLLDALPDGFPHAAQVRRLFGDGSGPRAAEKGARPGRAPHDGLADTGTPRSPAPTPPAGAERSQYDGLAKSAMDAVTAAADPEETLSALLSGLGVAGSGDPDLLNRTLGGLLDSSGNTSLDDPVAASFRVAAAGLLNIGAGLGGNLADGEAGREAVERVAPELESLAATVLGRFGGEGTVMARVPALLLRLGKAKDARDTAALDAVVAELTELEDTTRPDDLFRALLMAALAEAHLGRATLVGDTASLRRSFAYMDRVEEAAADAPPVLHTQLNMAMSRNRALRARLTRDPALLRGDLSTPSEATTLERWFASQSLVTRYELHGDPADLDAAIAELEQVRDALTRGERHYFAADALWRLAEVYQTRWARRNLEDQAAATGAAMEGLNSLAADVVLQRGSEHGLATARSGADRGVRAALWSAQNGQVEETVAALELGRALVLHAASVSAAVPGLLEARGHHDIADAWRRWGAARDRRPADELPRELPSTLRRQALEALGYRQQGAVFSTPTVAELQAGLADADADALFYLLPGHGGKPGMAVVVGPDTGTGVLQLPLLSDTASAPLDAYLRAANARSQAAPDTEAAWEKALSDLLDWAYDAAVGHLISALAQRLAANDERRRGRPGPPRIVLVPCGRLGAVPWHAARMPEIARAEHACQIMVITYAASGGQFLRTIRRGRRAPDADPVLVADPRFDLPHAEREATALHTAYYPGARLMGEFYEPPAEPVATGTPEDLLGLLGQPLSLLHIASHGSAGVDPTQSALHLAFPEGTEHAPPDHDGARTRPDPGMLTVTRLLDAAPAERPAEEGPLVVLSACETDLTKHDHDEALTLTTAFVASGARDVVGSRWTTRDGASALMMGVFHHLLAVDGLSPADALHMTQRWMLDPNRKAPPQLSPDLVREMEHPGLDRPALWAAFIHQGHPGPARRRQRTEEGTG